MPQLAPVLPGDPAGQCGLLRGEARERGQLVPERGVELIEPGAVFGLRAVASRRQFPDVVMDQGRSGPAERFRFKGDLGLRRRGCSYRHRLTRQDREVARGALFFGGLGVERQVDHLLFVYEALRHRRIDRTFENQVLHQDACGLPDPVAAVFGLRKVAGHPVEFREDHVGGGREREPDASRLDPTEEHLDRGIFLEPANRQVPVLHLVSAVEPDRVRPELCRESVRYRVVVSEDDDLRGAGVQDLANMIGHVGDLRDRRVHAQPGDRGEVSLHAFA